jgi:hypothetical protein
LASEVEKLLADRQPSTNDLILEVLKNESFSPDQKIALIDEIRKNSPAGADRWTYRYAIWILGGAVLLALGCTTGMAVYKVSPIPDGVLAIGSAAIGGLAGLLASPSRLSA